MGFTKAASKTANGMEREFMNGQMERNTQANGSMGKETGKVNGNLLLDKYTQEIGSQEKLQDMENCKHLDKEYTKETS